MDWAWTIAVLMMLGVIFYFMIKRFQSLEDLDNKNV
jgi:preprotein translocase subunit YajC